jgi:acetylornithine deacetylase/succinyl-diaminopimelate desuccinylase-like protein
MTDWEQVQAAAGGVLEAGLDDLLGALRIPSVSAQGRALDESANYLASLLGRDGWSVAVDEIRGNSIVLAEIGGGTGPGPILYGHHDVQPVDPESAWDTPPFSPTIRDGRLFARGAADNKGQFFCHILAVRALQQALGDVPIPVRLVLDGHEEIGSPEMPEFVDRHRGRLRDATFCLTADGPTRLDEQPEVVFGVRGALKLKLTVRTASTDLHSGNWGGLVPSAAWRLARILAQLKGEDGRVLVPGFYDGVVPPTESERSALAGIPFDAEAARRDVAAPALDGPPDRPPLERLMFLPTLTVNGIQGGYTGEGFKTVIPSEAFCYVDVRLVVDQHPDAMYDLLLRHLATIAPDAILERRGDYLPCRTSLDRPEAAHVLDAVEAGFGRRPLRVPCSGGSLPDAAFATGLGIPVFDVPYGSPDQRNHAPNENLRLDHLRQGLLTSANLLLRVGGRCGGPRSVIIER